MLAKKKEMQTPARPRASEPRGRPESLISRDMKVVGDCQTTGRIRIDGTISGAVRAHSMELSATGVVEGDVTALDSEKTAQVFVIAGRVEGSVRAPRVEVRADAIVMGAVEADEAIVDGRVDDGIVARKRLALGASGIVQGDVRAQRLSVEDGGQVNGTIHMGSRANFGAKDGGPKPDAAPARQSGSEDGAVLVRAS